MVNYKKKKKQQKKKAQKILKIKDLNSMTK